MLIKYALCFVLLASVYFSPMDGSHTQKGNLIIHIENFESDKGNVRVHLYSKKEGASFPKNSSNIYRLAVQKISGKKALVSFENLPYGEYAVTVHHDENLNVKMDLNGLGLPKEGWGLSKNIIPVFSLPSFDDCKFNVESKSTEITIIIRNL